MDDPIRSPSDGGPYRVLIADGDANVRAALRLLLARNPDFQVVADSQDVHYLLRDAATTHPDVILLDWQLPGLHASERLVALRNLRASTAIIALSTRDEQRHLVLDAGISAFVGKSEAPAQLLATLRAVAVRT